MDVHLYPAFPEPAPSSTTVIQDELQPPKPDVAQTGTDPLLPAPRIPGEPIYY